MATDLPLTRQDLIDRTESGESFEYFFFWGHTPPADGSVNKSCFSQWYHASFEVDGINYKTAEHWMMAEKARLFGDEEMLKQILVAPDPKAAKKLGRQVSNFDPDEWSAKCVDIVCEGNIAKFSQNEPMKEVLLSTGNTILVEAAPRDGIWGIGLGAQNERATDPAR
jgi:ribA/ribD-fused uncharacterized protein